MLNDNTETPRENMMPKSLQFLFGGGEMGELIRSYDWSKTAIGSPDTWSQSLRFAVRIMLDSPFGMYIAWGNEYIQMYNNGFRPILGTTKHPQALGISTRQTFSEIWTTIEPIFEGVMQGTPIGFPDFTLHLDRNGYLEECVFDLSYSPIRSENNEVGGVLVTVIETTEKVKAVKAFKESEEATEKIATHLKLATDSANVGTWSLDIPTQVLEWSALHKKMWGYDEHRKDLTYEDWHKLIVTEDKDKAFKKIEEAKINNTIYDVDYSIKRANDGVLVCIRSVGKYYYNDKGEAETLTGISVDITEQKEAEEKLKASEQDLKRYKHMADNANEPFILMRQDGTFAYLNDLALERWGYTKEEAQHIRVPDVDPIYNDEVFKSAFAASQKEKLPQFETLHKKKDGTIYPVEINMGGIILEGKPHLFAIARDITERKKLEKSVRESEKKIRNFILQAPVAMCLYRGPQHIIEIVNEELLNIWDKPLDSVINKPVFEAIPEAKNQGFEALLHKVYTTGEKFAAFGTPIILLRDGKPRTIYVNLVYQAYREVDGTISGIVEVVSDATEQVLATQQVEASERQFRTFADSIQNLAWIADGDGWINWYNQQWYDYTGTTFEEMQGWGWDKVHHPDHLKNVVEFVKEAWKKDEAFELTFPLRRYDGEYRWFLTRAYPVKDAHGNIERWIGTNTDVTEQKSFAEELEKKVTERTKELQSKNIELENTNAELASFSYIASHDLQEPLRKIQTFSNRIMETEIFSNQTQHYFNRIIAASERMRNLIASLLDYSRTNTAELIFNSCDLNTIIEESMSDLDQKILEKQAIIEYESLPIINGVGIQIAQLFTNLIDNAIKYSRPEVKPHIKITSSIIEGKKIEHSSANQKYYYAIKIADNGIGFEKENVNKIFELFQRLHHKNEYSGTGIGLAIVKKIVINHNGFIVAEGIQGIGSTFTIYFPKT